MYWEDSEAYSEHSQTSKIKYFAKIVHDFQSLNNLGSENASGISFPDYVILLCSCNLLCTYSCSDVIQCDALDDLVLFVEFKKREKTSLKKCYF